jgi:hypothetical protein
VTIVGCVDSVLPKCAQCGEQFEDFDTGATRCPECKPQRGREVQIDCWQYMRNSAVGYKLRAGFRLLTRGTT